MPFYDLPMSVEEILQGVDYYVVTHIHPDHIDMAMDGTVGAPLDKNVPVICQNEEDAAVFEKSGFRKIIVLSREGMDFGAARLTQVPARHGTVVKQWVCQLMAKVFATKQYLFENSWSA